MSIKIDLLEVSGFIPAFHGMRQPYKAAKPLLHNPEDLDKEDKNLAYRLSKAGHEHRKFMRMMMVYVNINAPLFWWKQMDTYKIGTVANSESTMRTITKSEFTFEDFGFDLEERNAPHSEVSEMYFTRMIQIILTLNQLRELYLKTKDETTWRCMIDLLPSSYMQKRTVSMNYEVLHNIYHQRRNHRLVEWRIFCAFCESLPYSWMITGKEPEGWTGELPEQA